jgi:N-acyl homoserine lactone hydrolase
VINAHLHSDHCGGNTVYDGQRQPVPTFPWAEYYVQRQELADAGYPNERTKAVYPAENVEPTQVSGQLRVLLGDGHVTRKVRVTITRRHTPGHQSVVIES